MGLILQCCRAGFQTSKGAVIVVAVRAVEKTTVFYPATVGWENRYYPTTGYDNFRNLCFWRVFHTETYNSHNF